MSFWRDWSDGKKWAMGIVAAVVVAGTVKLLGMASDRNRQTSIEVPARGSDAASASTVDAISVHVADTKGVPQVNIQLGAVSGGLVMTNEAGQARLPLSTSIRAWQRVEIQLGPDSSEYWIILDPLDRHVRAPDTEAEYERVRLLEKGCADCLQAEFVARRAVQYAWLESPAAPEAGLERVAASWSVTKNDLESAIGLLEQSQDPQSLAFAAYYNGEPMDRQRKLLADARDNQILVILAGDSSTETGLKAVDDLFTLDLLLFATDPENRSMVGSMTEGVRKAYEDAFMEIKAGNSSHNQPTLSKDWDPTMFKDLVLEHGA